MDDSVIIALIEAMSKDNALLYGTTQIELIDRTPDGNGVRIYFSGGLYSDIPISSFNFMFKNVYDPNSTGSILKSQTVQEKSGSIKYYTGEELLKRDNHTGTQKATTITIDKTNFKELNKDFTGVTVQDLADYLDNHKTFLNGIFLGNNTEEGSYKLVNDKSKLLFQRLENGVWTTLYAIGDNTTDVINLNKSYSAVNFRTSNTDMNLARISTDNKSVQIGDVRFEKTYLSGQELDYFKFADDGLPYNYIINNDTSVTQGLSAFEITINIPIQNSLNHCAIYGIDINNASTGYYNYNVIDISTGNVVYTTGTDFELKQGLSPMFSTTGLHTETSSKLIHLYCGRQYKLIFKAQSTISFKGGLKNNIFAPYCVLKYKLVESNKILSQKDVTDSVSSSSSTLVASAKAVNIVEQQVQAISSGQSPIVPISVVDFNKLTSGINGVRYVLTSDGIIGTETYHKRDIIYIVQTFKDRAITIDDYVVIKADNKAGGCIFITNIEAINTGKNVSKIMNDYPNQGSVKSAMSDDNSYRVYVEWDRSSEYTGQPIVLGKNVVGIQKQAGSYTAYVDILSTDITDSIVAMFNENTYTVPFKIVTPPVVNSITFGSLPSGQTELKEGDIVDITIVTDKPIDMIEVQDFGAFNYKSESVIAGTSITMSGIIANRGITLQQLTAKLKVRSVEGSWSEIIESTNALPINNLKPTLTLVSKTFSSGFSALKNSETCAVIVGGSNYDLLVSSAIGSELNVGAMSGLTCAVTRISGSYNDGVTNLRIVATRNANKSTTNLDICVEIANVASTFTTPTTLKLASGSGTQSELISFAQKVKITSITAPVTNLGNLVSSTSPVYGKSYNWLMSSADTDTKSNTVLYVNAVATNMAGIITNIQLPYLLAGFSLRTLSIASPSYSVALPCTVADISKLLITNGYINSAPPLEIMKTNVSYSSLSTSSADCWSYNVSDNKIYVSPATANFNFNSSNNITFQIQEIN